MSDPLTERTCIAQQLNSYSFARCRRDGFAQINGCQTDTRLRISFSQISQIRADVVHASASGCVP